MLEDFPNNLFEFEERFSTEEAYRDHFSRFKYPNGFICSRCQSTNFW